MKPLAGLVVVERTGSVAGAYCAKLFADRGAMVTSVGPSNLTRHQQAYYYDAIERSPSGDLTTLDVAGIDVLIESSAPAPLVPIDLPDGAAANHLTRVQISPFGSHGERAHWLGTDLVDYAISGHSYLYGHPDREPLKGPPDQPAVAAGIYGFIGAMASLLTRDRLDGRGQQVEVSHVQVMVALHQLTLLRWLMARNVFCRMGNRYTGQGQPNGPYPCADGWVSVVGVTQPQVEGILAVTGLTHLMDHPDITSPYDFQVHPHLLDGPLTEWFSTQHVDEVVELFQAMRIPAAPVLNMSELLHDPQLIDRGFFRPLRKTPSTLAPAAPFTFSHHQASGEQAWSPGAIEGGPLAGLKVLDLARVWAGPLCARVLSDLGADVVWIEAPWQRGPQQIPQSMIDSSRVYPNDEAGDRPWNRNGHFVKYSLGKQSLAVDLQSEAGQRVFERLVPHAHVLLENFSTRVMPQFGFDEERLHGLNPDLIYLTMPGFGRSGPAENWLAYGSSVDSHAGLSSLIGYRDQVPWKGGIAWPDPIAGLHAASAVLSALWSTQASGTGGLTIEAAQFESTVAAVGDRVIEAQVDGHHVPDGNRTSAFVAQGIYRCAGDDEWIAISVPDQAALERLHKVTGPLGGPAEHHGGLDHDAFDTALNEFTSTHQAHVLADVLQAAAIPAAKVTKAPDVMADPHLASRDAWVTVDQPDVGDFTVPVLPLELSITPPRRPTPAPTLGQHNEQVLLAAGFTIEQVDELSDAGTIVSEPPALL